ncbi:transcription repressor NadR [Yeguia hominis]|uniref:Transcription repressor NadR n=1 Tax=Yeguia hominis TaxID=2763662 RepID=A0A926D913_9FIRM|nr:transcription repressor NadR [Yeguia hominis]MBC8533562.1 transcription repressor NadR [Yeguia hominis]
MNTEKRRKTILSMLEGRMESLNASQMAEKLEVSRQIIVSDIALLRAQGHNILSTPRGYLLEKQEPDGYTGIILCQHGSEAIREEFYRIVDNGGVVLDVSIDHPIYGLLSASLNIRSRYDANLFLEQLGASTAKPLSALTEGFHTHRIRTEHAEDFARIEASLRELGILVDA